MLGLIRIGWISAALSVGVVAAMPAPDASVARAAGKQFRDRLGETETQMVRTGSRVPVGTEAAARSKGDRIAGESGAPGGGVTIERREGGLSILVRAAPIDAASRADRTNPALVR